MTSKKIFNGTKNCKHIYKPQKKLPECYKQKFKNGFISIEYFKIFINCKLLKANY